MNELSSSRAKNIDMNTEYANTVWWDPASDYIRIELNGLTDLKPDRDHCITGCTLLNIP